MLQTAARGVQTVARAAIPLKYSTRTLVRHATKTLAVSKFVALIHPLVAVVSRELRSLLHVCAILSLVEVVNTVSILVILTKSMTQVPSMRLSAVRQQHQHVVVVSTDLKNIHLLLVMLERKRWKMTSPINVPRTTAAPKRNVVDQGHALVRIFFGFLLL